MKPNEPPTARLNESQHSPFVLVFYSCFTYLMLGFGVAYIFWDPGMSAGARLACIVLATIWGTWYGVFVALQRRFDWPLPSRGILFLLAIIVSFVLSWLHPIFLMIVFSFYGTTFGVLPMRWAAGLIFLLSMGIVIRFIQLAGGLSLQTLIIPIGFFFATVFAIGFGLDIGSMIRRSRERQKMIDELQAARDDLARAERQAGVLEERQRLAGEILDTLAQGFISVILHLEAAEQTYGTDTDSTKAHLRQAQQSAREYLRQARAFLWDIRPEIASREPLARTMERIVARWSEESGVEACLEINGTQNRLPAAQETTFLRAAQEGLANVRKHAEARHVIVTLTYMDDEVLLDLQDDGKGFDTAAAFFPKADGYGYGLLSLRERALQLGGRLELESTPGEGATLMMALPVPSAPSWDPSPKEAKP